jgi:hypothetical protein
VLSSSICSYLAHSGFCCTTFMSTNFAACATSLLNEPRNLDRFTVDRLLDDLARRISRRTSTGNTQVLFGWDSYASGTLALSLGSRTNSTEVFKEDGQTNWQKSKNLLTTDWFPKQLSREKPDRSPVFIITESPSKLGDSNHQPQSTPC